VQCGGVFAIILTKNTATVVTPSLTHTSHANSAGISKFMTEKDRFSDLADFL
jgi:hypothetical protein